VKQQSLTGDVRLAEILDRSAAEFAAGWEAAAPAGLTDAAQMLADIDAVVRAVPDRPGLRAPHARLLLWTGAPADAYASAAAGVAAAGDAERSADNPVRDLLTRVIDDIAWADLNGADGTDAVAIGRDRMARYPLSVAPVIDFALAVAARGEPGPAVTTLSERLRVVHGENQAWALRDAVRRLRGADAAVQSHVQELWRRATTRVSRERSAEAVRAAIADLGLAATLARARGLGRDAGRLEAEIAKLRRATGATERPS
jgi:hypothetical protein